MKNFLIVMGVSLASGGYINELTTADILAQYPPDDMFGLWTIVGYSLHRESFCDGDDAARELILKQDLGFDSTLTPAFACICDMDFTTGKLGSFATSAADTEGSFEQYWQQLPAMFSDEGFCKAGTCMQTIHGILGMLAEPLGGLIENALSDAPPAMIAGLGIQQFLTDGLSDAVGCICSPTANWSPITVALGNIIHPLTPEHTINSVLDAIPAIMGKVGGLCAGSCFTFLRSIGDFVANDGVVAILSMLYVNEVDTDGSTDDSTEVVAGATAPVTAEVTAGVKTLLTALLGESSGSCICNIDYAALVNGVHAFNYFTAMKYKIDYLFYEGTLAGGTSNAILALLAKIKDNDAVGGMNIPDITIFESNDPIMDMIPSGMNNEVAEQYIKALPAAIIGSGGLCNTGCQAWFAGVVHAVFNFLHVDPSSQIFRVSSDDIPQMDLFFGEVVGCVCAGTQFDWTKIVGAAVTATKEFVMKWWYNSATETNEDGFMYSNLRDAPMVDALAKAIADISDGLIPQGFCATGACMRLANEFNGWITNSLNMVVQAMGGQAFFVSAEHTFHDCICSGEFNVAAYTQHVAMAVKQQTFGLLGAVTYPFGDGSAIAPNPAGFVAWAGELADLTFSTGGFCSSGCRSGAQNWVKAIINSISSFYSIANNAYLGTMIFPAGVEKPARLPQTFPEPLVEALSLIPNCICAASSGGTWSALLVKIPALIAELGTGNGLTSFTKVLDLVFGKEFFLCGGTCNGIWNGILTEVAASLDDLVPHLLVGLSSVALLTDWTTDYTRGMTEGSAVGMGSELLFGSAPMETKLADMNVQVPVSEEVAISEVQDLTPPDVDMSAIETGLKDFINKQCLCAPDTNWLNVITSVLSGAAVTADTLFTAVSTCEVVKVASILVVATKVAGVVSDWTPEKLGDFDKAFCKNILKRTDDTCWQEEVYTTAEAGSVILNTQIKSADPVTESKVVAKVTEAYTTPEATAAALMVPGLVVLEVAAIVKSDATAITKTAVAEKTGLSTGAIIGIAVGAGVGGILLIVAIVLLVCKKGAVAKKEKAIAA